jgi:hypothetical protein
MTSRIDKMSANVIQRYLGNRGSSVIFSSSPSSASRIFTLIGLLQLKLNSVASVRERTIPTERSPFVGKVSTNFRGQRVSRGQRNGFPRSLISVF